MDLNDASVASGKRDVSLELSDGRGSSFSSEDSCAPIISKPRAASLDNRLLDSGGGQASYPPSPRNERLVYLVLSTYAKLNELLLKYLIKLPHKH